MALAYNRIAYEIDGVIESPKMVVTKTKYSHVAKLPLDLFLDKNGSVTGRLRTAGTYEIDLTVETNYGQDTQILTINAK